MYHIQNIVLLDMAVTKSMFNNLLESYGEEILPEVILTLSFKIFFRQVKALLVILRRAVGE